MAKPEPFVAQCACFPTDSFQIQTRDGTDGLLFCMYDVVFDDIQGTSIGITRTDAIRLRDWLNQWLEETE